MAETIESPDAAPPLDRPSAERKAAFGVARAVAERATPVATPVAFGVARRLGRLFRLRDPFSFSTLTARIVALNVVALAAMVGGTLYLSQFRAGLIDFRIASLQTEADLIATTISEAAYDADRNAYERFGANEVLRRLSLPIGLRAQIYDTSGRLTGDTRTMSPAPPVQVERLDGESRADGLLGRIEELYDRALGLFRAPYALYRETPPSGISRDAEVYAALDGRRESAVRVNSENELILSVAAPIQRVWTVLGAIVLSTEGGDIDRVVAEERIAILQVFLVAFGATLLVSIALAQTIARPIRKLALAAESAIAAEPGQGFDPSRIEIPDLGARGDEIGHLSTALRRMTGALTSRLGAIESFAADVAHEIKNPLTSLRSAVEAMRFAKTPEQRDRLLAVIQNDVGRLDRLVTDISNASRLDAALVREARGTFDLDRLLATVLEIAAPQAEKRDVTLARRTTPTPIAPFAPAAPAGARLPMRGLEHRLAQVFHNLVDNALSFSPKGGRVLVTAEPTLHEGRPAVRVEVVDEGAGVPPESLERIFERFYSERPTSEAFGAHSGLGLSICRQIVEAHGGRIHAENRIDRPGARFVTVLPQ